MLFLRREIILGGKTHGDHGTRGRFSFHEIRSEPIRLREGGTTRSELGIVRIQSAMKQISRQYDAPK